MDAAAEWPAYMPGMDMSNMDMGPMAPTLQPWTLTHGLFLFAMWAVMMVGMMTPSVAPMVLIYQRIAQQANARGHNFASIRLVLLRLPCRMGDFCRAGHAGAVGTGICCATFPDDEELQQPVRPACCCWQRESTNGCH